MRHHGFALAPIFFGILGGLLLLAVALVGLGVMTFAYGRVGVPASWLFAVLLASLLGSFVNVPVARLRTTAPPRLERVVTVFGVQYLVTRPREPQQTVVALNVGGALVPMALAAYLVIHDKILVPALLAALLVAIVVHAVARPVAGVGITVPTLVPAILAALAALVVASHDVAAIAYVAGTVGVLVGADLTNLSKTSSLGAGVVSIGGAGTFDGIFVTGILAVVLAAL